MRYNGITNNTCTKFDVYRIGVSDSNCPDHVLDQWNKGKEIKKDGGKMIIIQND